MADMIQSTIAQLLFSGENALDFAKIVGELRNVLSGRNGDEAKITWDHDDLVVFDMAECRILLSWNEISGNGFDGCLSVSVGPSEATVNTDEDFQLEVLCSRLVERIQNRFNPLALVWRQVEGTVDAEVVDTLIERLPRLSPVLSPIDSLIESVAQTDRTRAAAPAEKVTSFHWDENQPSHSDQVVITTPPAMPKVVATQSVPNVQPQTEPFAAANDQPDLPLKLDAKLARVRIALYPTKAANGKEQPAENSVQMRLAAHALNATLIFVWAPIGGALITYSILNGGDIRLSARLMAICGTILAVSQTKVWQMVVSMTGV